MNRASITDHFSIRDVLRKAGLAVPADPRKLTVCPLHDDGTPSFRVFERGYVCFGCGKRGGVLDLVVGLGLAPDRAGAARWLENVR